MNNCIRLCVGVLFVLLFCTIENAVAQVQDGNLDDPGDIAFIAYNNADDGFSFLLLDEISNGTSIRFTDEEWTGAAFKAGTGEGDVLWVNDTGATLLPGLIVTIENANDGAGVGDGNTIAASIGTATEDDPGFGMVDGDQIYAITGTRASPGFFLAFIGEDNSINGSESAVLTGTGLTGGDEALITNTEGRYTGTTSCSSTATACTGVVYNSSNWTFSTFSMSSVAEYFTGSLFAETPGTVEITGNEGWRLLSLPKTGGVVTDVSDDTPVQGVTDGEDPLETTNFIIYDNTGSFEEPTNVSTAWGDGYGFGVYFFNNSINGSSSLPVTLDVSGSEPSSDVSVTLYNGASGRFTLVGNPFATNINANLITATGVSIQNNIAFWNDGTGSYSTQNRTTPYIISEWQGFWVETSDASVTGITIPVAAKTSTSATSTFFGKIVPKSTNRGDINFTLSSETTYDEAIRMSFRENATTEFDLDDATKLTPMLNSYATMAFATNNMLKSVESLPYHLEEEITIPLTITTVGISGEFSFAWSGLETIPAEWQITLHDYEMETSINMRDLNQYVFNEDTDVQAKVNPLSILKGPAAIAMKTKSGSSRFAITISPTSVSNEMEERPQGFSLSQNYPNPFNPSTTISYSIKEMGAVNISVYNLMGQKVATLVNEQKSAGQYIVRWDASGLSSGMYYYRLDANGQSITRKMTFIK